MLRFFKNLRLKHRLNDVGSKLETSYVLYINNNVEPLTFSSKDECLSYLMSYREENSIFAIKIMRVDVYSL